MLPPDKRMRSAGPASFKLIASSAGKVTLKLEVRDEDYELLKDWTEERRLKPGKNEVRVSLPRRFPTGRYYAEVQVLAGEKVVHWGALAYSVKRMSVIKALELDGGAYHEGDTLKIRAVYQGPKKGWAVFSVVDSFGRELTKEKLRVSDEMQVELPLRNVRAITHEVRLTIRDGDDVLEKKKVSFTVPYERRKSFLFMAWCQGFGTDARSINMARVLPSCGLDVNLIGRAEGAGPYGMGAIPIAMNLHGLLLDKHLFNRQRIEKLKPELRKRAEPGTKYGTLGYTLGDEPYVNAFKEEGRFSASPTVMRAFREFVKRMYGDIRHLNRQWGTRYRSFEKIKFKKESELLKRKNNPSPWCDYRMFVTHAFIRYMLSAKETIREVHPGARVGFDGAEEFSSHDGYDWYEMCRKFEVLGVYLRPRALHKLFNVHCVRSFGGRDAIKGFWINGRDWETIRYAPWLALFNGFDTLWWWESSFVGAPQNILASDYRPGIFFKPMKEELGEIKSGLATLLLHSERVWDGIAIHYSQNNFHASTLACGDIRHIVEIGQVYHLFDTSPKLKGHYAASWKCWFALLSDLGFQFDLIARQQIEQGKLTNATGYSSCPSGSHYLARKLRRSGASLRTAERS